MSVEYITTKVPSNQIDIAPKQGEEDRSASRTKAAEADFAGNETGSPEAGKAQSGGFSIDFPNGGIRSRLIVFGAMIVMGCSFGYSSAFGAWIGSLQNFFQFASGLLSGSLFDKFGSRAVMIPATIVYVFAVMMTSICKEYYQFVLAQGVLGGVGVGFLFAPASASGSQYFREKRAMALGITTGGASIGGALFPIALRNAFYSHLGFE